MIPPPQTVADPGISNWGVKISDIGCGDGKTRAKNRRQMEKQIGDELATGIWSQIRRQLVAKVIFFFF